MYFDFKPNNVSWLKSGEQQNGAGIYKTCYETLVEIVNGVNNYDLKVINQDDMVSGVVYDEYWILDQDEMIFRTPLTIATKSLSGAVVGNGMTLGLTNGSQNVGLLSGTATANNGIFQTGSYGQPVGIDYTAGSVVNGTVGITTDSTKSGIIAEQSNAQLYFKVANAVQNLELLDAGQVLEGLTDKLDRGNKQEIVSWGMPDYSGRISIVLPFTATQSGYVFAFSSITQGAATLLVNGVQVWTHSFGSSWTGASTYHPVNKGDIVTGTNISGVYFDPLKGAN